MPDATNGTSPVVRYYPYRTVHQYGGAFSYLVTAGVWTAFFHFAGGGDAPLEAVLPPVILFIAIAVALTLQARYVYVELTPAGIARQSSLRIRASVAWDQVRAVVWRPQRAGLGDDEADQESALEAEPWFSIYMARVLEVLYTGEDSRQRKMGIAGGSFAEANAKRIRDDLIQRLGLVQLPRSGRRQVWARPSTAPPPPG